MSLTPLLHLDAERFDLALEHDVALGDQDQRHLLHALRLRPGAPLVLGDGLGRLADGELVARGVRITGPVARHPRPLREVHVVQALAKNKKVDEVVRACTELGAMAFTVVMSQRSPRKMSEHDRQRARTRWQQIAASAAAQSRRAWVPIVHPAVNLAAFVPDDGEVGVVAHHDVDEDLVTVGRRATGEHGTGRLWLAVGPEGGWSDADLTTLASAGGTPARLRTPVLRTEHAAAACCAVFAHL